MKFRLNQFVTVMDPYSSIRQNVLGISKTLKSFGNEVSIYTIYSGGSGVIKENFIEGVKVMSFPSLLRFKKFKFSPKLLKHLKEIDGDIIHVHDCRSFEMMAALSLKKSKMIPLVVSTYASVFYVYSLGDKFFKMVQDALTLRVPLRLADVILAETEFEKKELMRFGVPEKRIRVIYGKVDENLFKKREADFFKLDGHVILYVGRINKIKGLDFLLKSFSSVKEKHSDAKLIIVGSPEDPDYLKKLKILATNLAVDKDVIFYGPVHYGLLPEVYSSADLLVLPSMWENLGNVLIEAQSCECPVIATNVGGTSEVMINDETGFLVRLGDTDDLANKVSFLLDDEEKRKIMGRNARRFVSKRFSLDVYMRRVLDVYHEVL